MRSFDQVRLWQNIRITPTLFNLYNIFIFLIMKYHSSVKWPNTDGLFTDQSGIVSLWLVGASQPLHHIPKSLGLDPWIQEHPGVECLPVSSDSVFTPHTCNAFMCVGRTGHLYTSTCYSLKHMFLYMNICVHVGSVLPGCTHHLT